MIVLSPHINVKVETKLGTTTICVLSPNVKGSEWIGHTNRLKTFWIRSLLLQEWFRYTSLNLRALIDREDVTRKTEIKRLNESIENLWSSTSKTTELFS